MIAGIVGHADLRLPNLDDVLDAHIEAGHGLFRGIRHALSRAEPGEGSDPGWRARRASPKTRVPRRRRPARCRGLTYDTWHHHYQNREFLALAHAVPDTRWSSTTSARRSASAVRRPARDVFERGKRDIEEIAAATTSWRSWAGCDAR